MPGCSSFLCAYPSVWPVGTLEIGTETLHHSAEACCLTKGYSDLSLTLFLAARIRVERKEFRVRFDLHTCELLWFSSLQDSLN